MMLTSGQRAVIAAAIRDTHGIPWADAIIYADTAADALNALEKRTIGEDRYGLDELEVHDGEQWTVADDELVGPFG